MVVKKFSKVLMLSYHTIHGNIVRFFNASSIKESLNESKNIRGLSDSIRDSTEC